MESEKKSKCLPSNLLFLCVGDLCWRILFHLPTFFLLLDAQLPRSSIADLTMLFTISSLPHNFPRVADVLNGLRGQISQPAEAGETAGSESDFSSPVFFESETRKDLSDIQERQSHSSFQTRPIFLGLPRTVRVIRVRGRGVTSALGKSLAWVG